MQHTYNKICSKIGSECLDVCTQFHYPFANGLHTQPVTYSKICSNFGSECIYLGVWIVNRQIPPKLLPSQYLEPKFEQILSHCTKYLYLDILNKFSSRSAIRHTNDKICSNFGSKCWVVNTTYNFHYLAWCSIYMTWQNLLELWFKMFSCE